MDKKTTQTSSKKTANSGSDKTKPTAHQKELKELKDKLTECEQLLFDSNERYMRLAAEFDNYRKRTQKEMGDIIEYAGEKVLRNILPVLDDFERAMANHEGDEDSDETLQKGLEMIYKKFTKTLFDMDVKPMETVNQPFDPDLHHAVMAKEVEDVDADIIVEEFEKGYLFKKHVLRHAKVVVSK
ncbi:MAG: nucleotide exchange factor GrpE [Candidatus Marinimicrobia bacterium]|nr:nucleotide exchange factor GrpE [Candidatus Neomarinimicrobiota bacterium]